MKVNISHAFRQIGQRLPSYAPVLEDFEKHLRETLQGKHSWGEFCAVYMLEERVGGQDEQSAAPNE